MLFVHSHVTSDGLVVVHAHPFAKPEAQGEKQSHSHTDAELLNYALNSDYLFESFNYEEVVLDFQCVVLAKPYKQKVSSNYYLNRLLRGPPSLS